MASDFETQVEKTLAASKTLLAALAPITAGIKTHCNNFDKANEMYFASEDQIKDLKKTPNDAKAVVELKKWETNHPKLALRVKSEFAEVQKLRAGVIQADKSELTVKTTYTKLNQGAAKAAMTDVPGTQADLKSIGANLSTAEKEIKRLQGVLAQYDTTLKIKQAARGDVWRGAPMLRQRLVIAGLFSLACAAGLIGAAPVETTAPATRSALPAGWVAGLDKEVVGVKPLAMNLWEGKPPGFVEGAKAERDDGTGRIWDVNVPGMLIYLPPADTSGKEAPPRMCIVFCAGGAYSHLTRLAGADDTVAAFVPKGIVVVALKYRLSPPSKNVADDALADGERAVRLVRLHAKEWDIDPHKVGMVGVSAGANLILRQSLTPELDRKAGNPVDAESFVPNFIGLLSPWPNGKKVSDYPVPAELKLPPAFIASARDDTTAPFDFAKGIKANWQKAGASVEFLATDKGNHAAFEISTGDEGSKWPEKFLPWLVKQGMWKQ